MDRGFIFSLNSETRQKYLNHGGKVLLSYLTSKEDKSTLGTKANSEEWFNAVSRLLGQHATSLSTTLNTNPLKLH